jgi:hypothetical protein
MTRAVLRATAASVLVAFALPTSPARADVTKSQCVDANANGQSLRMDGKLSDARRELQVCSDSACPPIVRSDCAERLDELERAQPTILFDVKDATGADLIAVKVTLDGQPVNDKLVGTALRVDPGEHTFTFAAPGRDPLKRTFVIKEGEKGRREPVVIGSPEATAQVPISVPTKTELEPAPAPSPAGLGTQKILGLTAGGLGVAGIAVGSVFGVMTFSAASAQKSDCASSKLCPNPGQAASDHSSGVTDSAVSTAGFIVGGALLVAGITLFFTARSGHPASRLELYPVWGTHGSSLLVRGAF